MDIAVIVVAFALFIGLFGFMAIDSKRRIKLATEDRRRLYRNCFLRGLAGILAKMSAADGSATEDEAAVATKLFANMGLSDEDRKLCNDTFQVARNDSMPGSYYASLFVPYSSSESRLLVYEILWDIAAADGEFAAGEEKFLRELLSWLELDAKFFDENLCNHARKFDRIDDAVNAASKRLAAEFQ